MLSYSLSHTRTRSLSFATQYPHLIELLVSISEVPIAGVPLTYLSDAQNSSPLAAENSTEPAAPTFDLSTVLSSRVYITNAATTCDLRSGADCSGMLNV